MSEENKQEEKKVGEEVTTPTKDNGDESKTVSELDRADQIAERQKRENDRREELLTREENLEARRKVGGFTEGKDTTEEKEETPYEYRKRINKEMAEGKTEFGN